MLDEVHRIIEERKDVFFVLTGSSARKLRRGNVNLLAGRALQYSFFPLTASEVKDDFSVKKALSRGMLPSVFSESNVQKYLESYLFTYLEQEVQQEGLTRNIGAFTRFLEMASFSQGESINISNIANDANINRKVAENYFSILEDLLCGIIFRILEKNIKSFIFKPIFMKVILMFLFILFPVLGFVIGSGEGVVFGLIADLFLLFFGVRIVKQNTVKLVEFLGKFNRILRPGFNVIIPFIEWTKDQDLCKKNFQVFVDGLTGDNVSTGIGLNVVYYVKSTDESIFQSVYEIDNPEKLIRATIDEEVRAMISMFTHKEIYTKRQEMGDAVESALRIKLDQFGYTLDSIQVQDIQLDPLVLKALNRIVETEKMK